MTERDPEELRAQLTGPGAPFEIVEEDVLGERMRVFRNRPRSLRELLARSAEQGEKDHIVYGDRRISFTEHLDLVARAARGLRERHGIAKGDRVSILAANRPEWVIGFWATVSLGGIVSALNGWWTRDEIRYALDHSQPSLLIGDRKRLARLEPGDVAAPVLEIESGFEALLDGPPGATLPDDAIEEDAPAVILYTSGTTGRPKGAVSSHRGIVGFVQQQMVAGAIAMLSSGRAPDPDAPPMCALVTAPLFHLSGLYSMAAMMLAVGARTVYREGRFDPEDVLRLIERERVTTWSALGSTGPRVLDHPSFANFDVSSVSRVGFGGAPTSPELQRRVREAFPNAAESIGLGYGSSESVAVVASIGGEELARHPTSVGPVGFNTDVEIRDAEGKALPEGAEGEIFVRSPYVMLGYWRDPDATRETLRPGRWLATGDIGRIEDGRLYINSRARDLILRAAENVYPAEVEHRLDAHPDVAESAVVGVDHPELGQEVKAIVVPSEGARLEPEVLAAWCAETLAGFKVPSLWEIRSEPLPRNAAGKVLKTVLLGEAQVDLLEE